MTMKSRNQQRQPLKLTLLLQPLCSGASRPGSSQDTDEWRDRVQEFHRWYDKMYSKGQKGSKDMGRKG